MAIARELGQWDGIATTLRELGYVDLLESDYSAARQRFGQALDIMQKYGDPNGIAITWWAFSALADRLHRHHSAAQFEALACHLAEAAAADGRSDYAQRFATRCDGLGYTQEQRDALMRDVEDEYRRDGGQTLLREAFSDL